MSMSYPHESPFLHGTNLPAVGDYNRSVVLDTIRKAGQISRVEVAHLTGLTAQTVTILTDLWDMDTVVFGGPYWQLLEDIYLDRVGQVLRRRSVLGQVHDFKVLSTTLGGDLAAIGAASAILDNDLTPSSSPGMSGKDRPAL